MLWIFNLIFDILATVLAALGDSFNLLVTLPVDVKTIPLNWLNVLTVLSLDALHCSCSTAAVQEGK
jgi:hypothetical protein